MPLSNAASRCLPDQSFSGFYTRLRKTQVFMVVDYRVRSTFFFFFADAVRFEFFHPGFGGRKFCSRWPTDNRPTTTLQCRSNTRAYRRQIEKHTFIADDLQVATGEKRQTVLPRPVSS